MSLELCILASGSIGNAALLRSPAGVMLIDLGIGPRITAKRLAGTGVTLADISAVCLTHLDSDHFNINWVHTLVRRSIRLFCHLDRIDELAAMIASEVRDQFARLIEPFDSAMFS